MRDPIVVGVAAVVALVALPILVWLFLAAIVSPERCAWIMGVGGCLP